MDLDYKNKLLGVSNAMSKVGEESVEGSRSLLM